MLKNYFTIAGRDVVKHKSYLLINAAGLAFGICACIVSFLVSDSKFNLDNFDRDGSGVYRVVGAMQNSSGATEFLNSDVSEVAVLKCQGSRFEPKRALIAGGSIRILDPDERPKIR
jgi:hypothetical protein